MRRIVVMMALVITVVTPVQAHAVPDALDLIGRWRGFSYVGDGTSNTLAVAEVYHQDGRRFRARLSLEDHSCELSGTVGASMQVIAAGTCRSPAGLGTHVQSSGNLWVASQLTTNAPIAASLDWTLTGPGGARTGDLVLLLGRNGPRDALVGRWEGPAFDDAGNRAAHVVAEFAAEPGQDGTSGYIQWLSADDDNGSLLGGGEVIVDLRPTNKFGLVGGGSGGVFLAVGDLAPASEGSPSMIEGTLVVPGLGRGSDPEFSWRFIVAPGP